MAVTINTALDTNYFELNGKRYARIYVPLVAEIGKIAIYNGYDTSYQLMPQTPFYELIVDGTTYLTIEETVNALLPIVWKYQGTGGGGGSLDWGNITGILSNQTDLNDVLNGKLNLDQSVPQTVLNGSPNFSEGILSESILFDTGYITTGAEPQGSLNWNSTDNTLDLVTNGATLQIGQELYIRARNTTGSTLANGSVVYITGRTGIFPNIALAKGDSAATGNVIGVLTEVLSNNAFGMVTTAGYVRGIKTNYTGTGIWGTTWVQGDKLYTSKDTAGALTNIEPSAPHHSDTIGSVGVVHPSQGTILVINDAHTTLESLSDVNGTPLDTNGQLLVWDNDNNYFDFTDNINNYLPLTGGVLTGSLTATSFVISGGTSDDVLLGDGSTTSLAGISGGAGVAWGSITGTLSAQTDLQTALDGKLSLTGGTLTGNLTAPIMISTTGQGFRTFGSSTGVANISYSSFYESNGTVRNGYIGFPTSSNSDFYMYCDAGLNYLRLRESGGSNGLTYYWSGGAGTVWHGGNDGAGSGLDADLFHGFGRSASSDRWTKTVVVEASGVAEIGRYIDFHNTAADATDNTFRIDNSTAGFLNFQGDIEVDDILVSGAVTRSAHNGGYLEGGHNNIGSTSAQSSPIYTIGSAYVPATTTLGNMYGVGFCSGGATFINSTDLGTAPSTGNWGMYVAADGNARIFLDSTSGRGYFLNNVWAANFILNSDKAYKKGIKYLNDSDKVRGLFKWAKYQYKNNAGIRYGAIANDVELTNPELVGKDDEGMRSLGYFDLFSLDAAHKDKRITELEDTVEELRAKIELIIKELL